MRWLDAMHEGANASELLFQDNVQKRHDVLHVGRDASSSLAVMLKAETVVHVTSFVKPKSTSPIQRPVCAILITRKDDWKSAPVKAGDLKWQPRGYINDMGDFSIEHGQGYPANLLGCQQTYSSEKRMFVVLTCDGLSISTSDTGQEVQRIMLRNAVAYAFNCDRLLGFSDAEVVEQFSDLWQDEFMCPNAQMPVPLQRPAFTNKFHMEARIVLRRAFTTNLSLIRDVARRFPDSGIQKHLSSSSADKEVTQSTKQQSTKKQCVSNAVVRCLPQQRDFLPKVTVRAPPKEEAPREAMAARGAVAPPPALKAPTPVLKAPPLPSETPTVKLEAPPPGAEAPSLLEAPPPPRLLAVPLSVEEAERQASRRAMQQAWLDACRANFNDLTRWRSSAPTICLFMTDLEADWLTVFIRCNFAND